MDKFDILFHRFPVLSDVPNLAIVQHNITDDYARLVAGKNYLQYKALELGLPEEAIMKTAIWQGDKGLIYTWLPANKMVHKKDLANVLPYSHRHAKRFHLASPEKIPGYHARGLASPILTDNDLGELEKVVLYHTDYADEIEFPAPGMPGHSLIVKRDPLFNALITHDREKYIDRRIQ
jgi:hypothetical protein